MTEWPPSYQVIFWQAYPRRIDKKKAMQKLEVIRRGSKTQFSDIIAGVEGYARYVSGTEPQFIKHPATWLNNECWTNEYPKPNRSGESAFVAGMATVAARYGVEAGVGQASNPSGESGAHVPGNHRDPVALECSEWVSGTFQFEPPTDRK